MSKVLIIDDNQKNVEILKDFVEAWGYETCCAYQGILAVSMVEEEKPDIVLLDVMLPGMSGFEVAARLRSNERTSDIPIIMISALTSAEDRANGFANGADNFLVKPINYKELKAVMIKLLKLRNRIQVSENEAIVLEKLLGVVKNYIVKENIPADYDEEKMLFYQGVFNRMHFEPTILKRLLWVLRFQYYYAYALGSEPMLAEFTSLLDGLRLNYWLQPLLAYSCRSYGERPAELVELVRQRRLEKLGDYCYIVKRFHDTWLNCGKSFDDMLAILQEEKKRYAYNEDFCDVLESSIEAHELKKMLDSDIL